MKRLAFSNIAWGGGAADREAARVLRAAGIAGVEIAPTAVWKEPLAVPSSEVDAYRRQWSDEGLQVVAMQALLYGHSELTVFGPAPVQSAMLAHLEGMFVLGARLGASALVFGSPKNRLRGSLPEARALDEARDFFARAAALAESHGVTLCLEPNPAQYGCDFVLTTGDAVKLVSAVGRRGLGVQIDGGALALNGESPAAAVRTCADWLGHVHASEPFLAPFGQGGTDHAGLATALAASGYDGWVSVEMRQPEGGDPLAIVAAACRDFTHVYGRGRA
jgi:D-psicose/D-tagatose/L-ribulose 3-epimerase